MKKWNGKVKVYGPGLTYIFDVEINIPEKLYARAKRRSENNKPLTSSVYNEIQKRLDAQFDLKDYLNEHQSPEDFCVIDSWVVDPGDSELGNLREKFVGKRIDEGWEADTEESTEHTHEIEDCDEDIRYTHITYSFNNKGILTDIISVTSEILESDGPRGGALVEDYPDYGEAEDYFQELVDEYEDYEDEDDEDEEDD